MPGERPSFLPAFTKDWHTSPPPSISPSRPELSVKGKNIIITGGGTGIGAAIALSFAKAGASAIGLVARREDKLKASKADIEKLGLGTKVEYALADVVDAAALEKAFTSFLTSFGKINVLVANAGYIHDPSSILEADPADWWKTIEINIRGPFNSIRAFAPVAADKALFINITSGVGHLPASNFAWGPSGYAVSKLANSKLVEYAAVELKDKGISMVNVQPGVVSSDMQQKSGAIEAYDTGKLFPILSFLSIRVEI